MSSLRPFHLSLLSLSLACQGEEEKEAVVEWLNPTEAGPHAVGVFETTYPGSDGIEKNALIWHPTTETDGDLIRYSDLILSDLSQLDVEPNCEQPWPVVLFSHANSAINWQSSFLVERLASQGYVVMAPMHHENNFFDDDGERIAIAKRRPQEIKDAADRLFDVIGDSTGDLAGCIDPADGYAVMGHSFGGYTTLALAGAPADFDAGMAYCENDSGYFCDLLNEWADEGGELGVNADADPRIWAAAPMVHAGYEVFHGGLDQIETPMLLLGASEDTSTLDKMHLTYDGLGNAKKRYMAVLEGAGHFSYSDICDLGFTSSNFNCDESALDSEIVHRRTNTWVSAFLQEARGREDVSEFLPGELSGVDWRSD